MGPGKISMGLPGQRGSALPQDHPLYSESCFEIERYVYIAFLRADFAETNPSSRLLERGELTFRHFFNRENLQTYESNFEFKLRFMVDKNVSCFV